MVDGEYIDADIGSFIIFDKYKIQSYYACNNKNFMHDFMHFDLDTDYERIVFSDIPKGKLLHVSLPNNISSILAEIKNELYSTFVKYKHEILTSLGTAFLYRIKNEIQKSSIYNTKKRYFPELYNLRLEIYRDPQEEYTIEAMSKRINLSRSYFQYLYKSFFSVSCTEDVINARIARAKILLSSTSLTVSETAEKCGYSNTEHFVRQFKIKTGTTPIKFRNR